VSGPEILQTLPEQEGGGGRENRAQVPSKNLQCVSASDAGAF